MSEDNIQSNIPEMEALISARPSLFMRSGALIILGVLLIILLLARFIQAPEVMTSNCTIYAGKPATLCCFENSGTLDTVMVCEGQSIQKGTPLATVSGSVSYNDYVAFHELKKKLLICN